MHPFRWMEIPDKQLDLEGQEFSHIFLPLVGPRCSILKEVEYQRSSVAELRIVPKYEHSRVLLSGAR